MASHQDLQELLRIIVARKVPMMTAMGQVKALQSVNLRSIPQIADAEPNEVESALGNAKAARSLQSACQAHAKRLGNKRAGDALPATGKRPRMDESYGDPINGQQSFKEKEDALALPFATDERDIAATSVYTNRAPLLLAFALELLRYTMPEQPLSSRLSLAHAVVSANSRSKAASIGRCNSSTETTGTWSEGQPRVTVMGRSIPVLTRGEYQVRRGSASANDVTVERHARGDTVANVSTWAVSNEVSSKSSAFVARVASLEHHTQAPILLRSLLSSEPRLRTATHNSWGYRIGRQGATGDVQEACEDDGETGCGKFILRLMKEADVHGAIVVLSRWYGGEMLGPDRWRLVRNCVTEALSERLRLPQDQASHEGMALWALGIEGTDGSNLRSASHRGDRSVVGAAIHQPESARAYLMKSFTSKASLMETPGKSKSMSKAGTEAEELQNLEYLLGALRLLFESWAGHLTPVELDRRAWAWYVAVRPNVEPGPAGWGAKDWLKLRTILDLRRQTMTTQSLERTEGDGLGGQDE